jgi:hypothetical protein
MKHTFLKRAGAMLLLAVALNGNAQLASVIPDAPLPTIPGPALRPQNAGSSTMQNINFDIGGGTYVPMNLYVHSWDVFNSLSNNGIAWERTDAGGAIQDQGYITVPYAQDIDVVLYEDGGQFYVLAAYYFSDPFNPAATGHYYQIFDFTPTGLVAGPQILLTLSPSFGRINVDANTPYGLAIVWSVPGTGIYATASQLPFSGFGCNVLLPSTAGFKDPDVAIRRSSGVLDLDLVYRRNTENQIRKYTVSLFSIEACNSAGYVLQQIVNSSASTRFSVPRIDCPDQFSTAKWTYVYSEYGLSGVSPAITVGERIRAQVFNSGVSAAPTSIVLNSTSYVTNFYQQNNPVLAYNDLSDEITVGWITRDNTAIIPGTTTNKYLAEYISDNGFGLPFPIPASLMMISNVDGGPAPVLAFSGQNINSSFDGINAAFSQYSTVFPGNYSMMYKHKPFSSATFRTIAPTENGNLVANGAINVFPSPFKDKLTLNLAAKGNYAIYILAVDGKVVLNRDIYAETNSTHTIMSEELPAGLYFVRIQSEENGISEIKKVIKE